MLLLPFYRAHDLSGQRAVRIARSQPFEERSRFERVDALQNLDAANPPQLRGPGAGEPSEQPQQTLDPPPDLPGRGPSENGPQGRLRHLAQFGECLLRCSRFLNFLSFSSAINRLIFSVSVAGTGRSFRDSRPRAALETHQGRASGIGRGRIRCPQGCPVPLQ